MLPRARTSARARFLHRAGAPHYILAALADARDPVKKELAAGVSAGHQVPGEAVGDAAFLAARGQGQQGRQLPVSLVSDRTDRSVDSQQAPDVLAG